METTSEPTGNSSVGDIADVIRATAAGLPLDLLAESQSSLGAIQESWNSVTGGGGSEAVRDTEAALETARLDLVRAGGALAATGEGLNQYLVNIGAQGADNIALSRYDYTGSDPWQVARHVDSADQYLRNTVPRFDAEEILDHGLDAQIEAMQAAVLAFGADLGVDLSDRCRGRDYFHIFSPEQFVRIREQFGLDEGSVAVHLTSGHMFIMQGANDMETLANAGHELAHVIARKSIRLEVKNTDEGAQVSTVHKHSGFKHDANGVFSAVNEVITELINIDLIRNYWPRYPALRAATEVPYDNVGYLLQLILKDEIFKANFSDPLAALRHIERGALRGKMGALRIINDAVGSRAMRNIARMDDRGDKEGIAKIAEDLGLAAAADKIRREDKTDLLNWL